MKKSKRDGFLRKYAAIALGAGVAAGASLAADAPRGAAAADSGANSESRVPPAAPEKTTPPGAENTGGSATKVPISVVYGPPPSARSVGAIRGSSPLQESVKIAPSVKPKSAGDKPAPDKDKPAAKAATGVEETGKK